MPTVLRTGPYRLFFYSANTHEPPHVHVERDRNRAKFWLAPVTLQSSSGFARRELLDLYGLITDHQRILLGRWYDYFGDR
ncbi:MAG TPA: DUF4160 domain-containing protein [Chthoniobacterales bacterium]|nr:DUF4160 domain-containing protein [Chthoniobacterales bacterium]